MEDYGVLSLLPMGLAIVLVLITRRTAISLLAGTVVGALLLYGTQAPARYLDLIYTTLGGELWIWVFLLVGFFGSLVALFEASGGIHGFTDIAVRFCKNQRRSLLAVWLLSIVVFVDDYLAILAVGASMRRATDRFRIPREMLAFLICTVSAAACVLIPTSSWGMFMTSQLVSSGICAPHEGIVTYLHLIPFLFYPLLMVLCGGLYAAGVLPVFGPMKRAYQREAALAAQAEEHVGEQPEGKGNAWNLILPMAVITLVTLLTGDALYGIAACLLSCALLYLPQKLMTAGKFLDTVLSGFQDMMGVLVIVAAAFLLRNVNDLLGMPEYVIGAVGRALSIAFLPAAAFLVAFALGFAAGNFWGVCAISVTVIIPMAQALGGNLLLTAGAIISGIVASCNACFFASQASLAATVTETTNATYAKTALPLQLIPFGASALLYLGAGFLLQ